MKSLLIFLVRASYWLTLIASSLNLAVVNALPSENMPAESQSRTPREEKVATHTPIIISKSSSLKIKEGETVTFPCDVKDLDPYLRVWLFGSEALYANNFRITNDNRYSLVDEPNNTVKGDLVLKGVQFNDSGIYVCRIGSNDITQALIQHELLVVGPPHLDTLVPTSGILSVSKHKPINLTCKASGVPPPNISWTRINGTIRAGVDVNNESLIIPNATREDSGMYRCHASNQGQYGANATFHVLVQHEPEIEVRDSVVYTGVNQSAILVCYVHASPAPHTRWLRKSGDKNTELAASDKFVMFFNESGSILTLRIDGEEDFGDYVCSANNSLGHSATSIEVSGKPSKVVITSDPISRTDHEYLLMWEVTSYEPITEYQIRYKEAGSNEWTKLEHEPDENQVGPVYKGRTLITNLEMKMYSIQIQARNLYGWNRPSLDLSVSLVGTSGAMGSVQVSLIVIISVLFTNIVL